MSTREEISKSPLVVQMDECVGHLDNEDVSWNRAEGLTNVNGACQGGCSL